MIKAILFDGWHTLFHNTTRPSPLRQFNDLIGKSFNDYDYVYLFEQTFMLDNTGDLRKLVKKFLSELLIDQDDRLIAKLVGLLEMASTEVEWYPDALPTLKKLRGPTPLGLASNCWSKAIPVLRNELQTQLFFDIEIFSCGVQLLKPDPRFFFAAASEFGMESKEILMVGDHPISDYQGAKKAGMQAMLIDRKGKNREIENRIESLEELPALVFNINNS